METITIVDWSIFRYLGGGYDPIKPTGTFIGHPSVNGAASPSTFLTFDAVTLTGKAISGRTYVFERESFQPNGFAKTIEEAVEWIQNNWIKK